VARYEHSPHATVVTDDIFSFVLEHEVRTAVRMRYPVSVLAIHPRTTGTRGAPVPGPLIDRLAGGLAPILRATDLIRRSPPTTALHLLLVGAPLEALPGIIQRIAAEAEAHRLLVEGTATLVELSVGGACLPTSARSALELVARADTLAQDAPRDPGGALRYRLR
jgi:hypothetical protein